MRLKIMVCIAAFTLLCGCIEGKNLSSIGDNILGAARPSEAEIVSALKEALTIGAKEGAQALSKNDAYYKSIYKILLPPDADGIIKHIARIPGGQKKLDDVLLGINRAAESAAASAAPIFANAISGMSVRDGMNILTGPDNAATAYLQKSTRSALLDAYRPNMQAALAKPVLAGVSAQDSWSLLMGSYNKLAGSLAGQIAGMNAVHSDLGEYVLEKAVDAIFLKIADEEKAIRANPLNYSSSIIKKVFGYAKNAK